VLKGDSLRGIPERFRTFLPLRVFSECIEIVETAFLPISVQGGHKGRPYRIGVDSGESLIDPIAVGRRIDVVHERLSQQRFHFDEVVPVVVLEDAGRRPYPGIRDMHETEAEFQHLLDTNRQHGHKRIAGCLDKRRRAQRLDTVCEQVFRGIRLLDEIHPLQHR